MSDVFISYSTDDKRIAGAVKQSLCTLGVDGFLAHEDLEISELWQKRILDELAQCAIYLAIVTPSFQKSDWTDQEAGFAMGRNSIIASFLVDGIPKPHGFLGRHQGHQIDSKITLTSVRYPNRDLVKLLVSSIVLRKDYLMHLVDKLILGLRNSSSYDDAGDISEILAAYGPSIGSKANWLFECAMSNGQVCGSGSAAPYLRSIWLDNIAQIDGTIQEKARTVFTFR